jgi:hypothetical protein
MEGILSCFCTSYQDVAFSSASTALSHLTLDSLNSSSSQFNHFRGKKNLRLICQITFLRYHLRDEKTFSLYPLYFQCLMTRDIGVRRWGRNWKFAIKPLKGAHLLSFERQELKCHHKRVKTPF